jgi:phage shock protein PspC (stress-responsive transcriptional regulator)
MIGGVCAGLGEYFGIDPTLMRVLLFMGVFVGFPGALGLIYLIMLILVPDEAITTTVPPIQESAPETTS